MRLGTFAVFALTSLTPGATLAASTSTPTPTTTPTPAYTVHIKDFKFAPTPLHVHMGDLVRFINDDDEAHTVTASDKSFDSTGMDTAGTWDHTFTKPGTYAYFCELHPYMKATVIVAKAVNK